MADIGGANGFLLRCILARAPPAWGLVCDLAEVVSAIPPDGLPDRRPTTAAGDFFDNVPAGADHCLLVRVLRGWPDDDCLWARLDAAELLHDEARFTLPEAWPAFNRGISSCLRRRGEPPALAPGSSGRSFSSPRRAARQARASTVADAVMHPHVAQRTD